VPESLCTDERAASSKYAASHRRALSAVPCLTVDARNAPARSCATMRVQASRNASRSAFSLRMESMPSAHLVCIWSEIAFARIGDAPTLLLVDVPVCACPAFQW